ncbi:MAG: fibronectin type III domain-containing protein [Geobacteraceae bacterium]|nr:fibronectin type III domain-containing protein [Geobacteraceae bacterium]
MKTITARKTYWQHLACIITSIASCTLLSLVLAGCSSGTSSETAARQTLAAPATATAAASDGQAIISWEVVKDAESYTIYMSNSPNVDPATATKMENAYPPYTVPGLVNGTIYYFRVQAVCTNTNRVSETSAEISVTPKTPPPGAPAEISAMAGDTFVVLQWSPVAGATSYNLYWGVSPGISKMAGEHFSGVTSPYIHYIPIDDAGAMPGKGGEVQADIRHPAQQRIRRKS